MKKLYSTIMMLAIMVAALSFTACGSDDDGDAANTSIVGVWECTSAHYGEWESYLKENLKAGDVLTLNADKTYTVRGNDNESGTYSVKGSTLTFKSSSASVDWTIQRVSSNTLSLRQNEFGFRLSFSRK